MSAAPIYVSPPNYTREEFFLPSGTKITKSASRLYGFHEIKIEPKGNRDLELKTIDIVDAHLLTVATDKGTMAFKAACIALSDDDLAELHQALGDHLARRHLVKQGLFAE